MNDRPEIRWGWHYREPGFTWAVCSQLASHEGGGDLTGAVERVTCEYCLRWLATRVRRALRHVET